MIDRQSFQFWFNKLLLKLENLRNRLWRIFTADLLFKNMKKFRKWRIIYWVCCFVYLGWMINLGTNEYDRINSQYRRIANQLDAGRIRTAALEELGTEWCKKSIARPDLKEDACFSWPPVVVEAREKKIEERLGKAKKQAANE